MKHRPRHAALPQMHSLESRWLYSVDLAFTDKLTIDRPLVAGGSSTETMTIVNQGTQTITQPFFVEIKLVKSADVGPPNSDFYDSAAVRLAMVQVDSDIAAGSIGLHFSASFTFPSDLTTGRYSIITALDSTLAVAETNESNNYVPLFDDIAPTGQVMDFDGTEGNDDFTLFVSDNADGSQRYNLDSNGGSQFFTSDEVTGFVLRGLGGDDTFRVVGNVPSLQIDGGDGNDKIAGGDGNETLIGGAGKDQIDGGGGNDRLNGNGGNDKLTGNSGADRLYGYAGNDYMDGGSSGDRLEGGAGLDTMLGESGNDKFFINDHEIDQAFGGSGTDTASVDANDILGSIESSVIA